MFKKGDIVVLNNEGKDCYQRNIHYKSIPENKLMKIKGHKGFDNGKNIWEVEWRDKTDYYFQCCLERLNMGKMAE